MNRITMISAVLAITLTGCATAPPPTYTSSTIYSGLDCTGMRVESTRMQQAIAQKEAAKATKNATTGVAVVAGLLLFWPALFLIQSTAAEEGQISQLRSNHDALNEASSMKGCGLLAKEAR